MEEMPVPLPSLLDLLPVAAAAVDGRGTILHGNPCLARLAGRGERQIAGADLFGDLFPELERRGVGEAYRRAAEGGGEALDPAECGLGDHSLRLSFSFAAEGPARCLVFCEDRTEVIRERHRRQRAERLASVGEIAAGAAHEVNNPLASIKSFAQLLVRDALTDAQREALEIIIHESTRVAEVVGDLLSYARQQGAGDRQPVDLNIIADRVLTLQRYALQTAGIELRRDFDAALSPVLGDASALQQVVLNLVVNAEQALSTRTGTRFLIVRTRESSEGVILSVVDNGPGIPRELLPHIFDAFRTTKPEGTGLGLGISASLVRDHSGQIWAESEPGRGAAFFVRLPRAAEARQKPAPSPVASSGALAMPGPGRSLRVLVADDEPTLRMAISLFLDRFGHAAVQAGDAGEAIRLATEQPFDVALIDARMPGDGLHLLEQLEAMPALRGRTVLMTGDIGRARTSEGIAAGRPFLAKPFDMEEMVRLLERLGTAPHAP